MACCFYLIKEKLSFLHLMKFAYTILFSRWLLFQIVIEYSVEILLMGLDWIQELVMTKWWNCRTWNRHFNYNINKVKISVDQSVEVFTLRHQFVEREQIQQPFIDQNSTLWSFNQCSGRPDSLTRKSFLLLIWAICREFKESENWQASYSISSCSSWRKSIIGSCVFVTKKKKRELCLSIVFVFSLFYLFIYLLLYKFVSYIIIRIRSDSFQVIKDYIQYVPMNILLRVVSKSMASENLCHSSTDLGSLFGQ